MTKAKARRLLKLGIGKLDSGRYRVVDAFLKAHSVNENITVDLIFEDLIKSEPSNRTFSIKFVTVDIPMNSEIIIGLADIK